MIEEDSKELAEAGSYGLRLRFLPRGPMTGRELGEEMGSALLENARPLAKGGLLLGHVKSVARTGAGFVKVSVVDLRLGPELDTDLADAAVGAGTINIMAAAAGHTDLEVRRAVEAMAAALSKRLELEEDGEGSRQILELR